METYSQKRDVNSQNCNEKQFISAYSPKQKISLKFEGEGRTKQSFKAECDINQILARYQRTGVLDFQQKYAPQYGDVTAIDFQKAQFMIAEANGLFAQMPSKLRARFDNDPAKFLAFVDDDRNRLEAEDLGLLRKKENEAGQAAEAPSGAAAKPPANPTASGGVTPHTHDKKSPQGSKTPSPAKSGEGHGEG